MALSFFHGDQLVRGAAAAEEIEIEQAAFSSWPESDEHSRKSQRLQSHTIRKLQSETALSARARAGEAGSVVQRASYAREDKGKETLGSGSRSRPTTSHSYHSDSSEAIEVAHGRSLAILGVRKPSFLNVRSNSTKYAKVETTERPPSGAAANLEEATWRKREPYKGRMREEFSIGQRASIPVEAAAMARYDDAPKRTSAAHGNGHVHIQDHAHVHSQGHNPAIRASSGASGRYGGGGGSAAAIRHSQVIKQNPPRLFIPPKDTIEPAQFLAEALAHVIVGEWLYKDPNKPGLMPQANILQRHLGPPPRGATGLPQKRWFRIDPYERLLTWSSKWDTAASAQHKARRRVPIDLVFEVPNRIVLKITAPDETRHALWMTALQYLVDSKRIPANAWPDVLAARLSTFSSVAGIVTAPAPLVAPPARTPIARAAVAVVSSLSGDPCKPLPPTPTSAAGIPGEAYQLRGQTASTIMTPPAVPRYSHHAHRDSGGELSIQRSEVSGTSPSPPRLRGKDLGESNNNNNNNDNHDNHNTKISNLKTLHTEQADMYASNDERRPVSAATSRGQPSRQSRRSQVSRLSYSSQPPQPQPQQQEEQRQRPLLQPYEHQHREHRPQEADVETITDNGSDDYEVDQMDELVAGLGNI